MKRKGARMFVWIILILVVVLLGYIRLAPTDPSLWHKHAGGMPVMGEKTSQGSYTWRQPVEGDGRDLLQAWDAAAMATPRTERLDGSIDAAMITYVTRSKWVGFPDYTTIGIFDGAPEGRYLEAYGRLRFGRSDFGVNAERVKAWRATVEG